MHTPGEIYFSSEVERRKLARRCGLLAALGWMALEVCFELLFGSHVRLMRSVAIGSGLGAMVGFLTSASQWLVLRGYVRQSVWWIPAGTAGSTLGGLAAGCILYIANEHAALYRWTLPLQGTSGALLVGLVVAGMQWAVLSGRVMPERGWRDWALPAVAGSMLGVVAACAVSAAITALFGAILEKWAWPYILLAAYLAAGLAGGVAYGVGITRGFKGVLPRTERNHAREGVTRRAHRGTIHTQKRTG